MPIPVISVAQMRQWEAATWATGTTEQEVIRRVGKAVADYAANMTQAEDLVLILAGKGNNGEDARKAREYVYGRKIELLDVHDPAADYEKLERLLDLQPALIIDALFGIGLNRPLNPDWIRLIERINQSRRPVLAVDVPSGLDAETGKNHGAAVQASITLTVGAPKRGLLSATAWNHVGKLEVAADVGLVPCTATSGLLWNMPEEFAKLRPPRPIASHKGTHGHLGIIAGSLGFHGAAVLAARAAQRAQPGLITLHTAPQVYIPVASQLQAVMVGVWKPELQLGETWTPPVAQTSCLRTSWTALLVGPGLASPELPEPFKQQIAKLWQESPLPIIVDASALTWLPRGKTTEAIRVLTPHPGEAARMLGSTSKDVQADRPRAVREVSRHFGDAWVVLKGHQTLIGRNEGHLYINSSGNPYLAQGGSGDVLGGFLAGLLAQPAWQNNVLEALRFGVWEHGAAADRLQKRRAGWVVEDLVGEIGAGES